MSAHLSVFTCEIALQADLFTDSHSHSASVLLQTVAQEGQTVFTTTSLAVSTVCSFYVNSSLLLYLVIAGDRCVLPSSFHR